MGVFHPLGEPVHEKERKSNVGRKLFDVVLMNTMGSRVVDNGEPITTDLRCRVRC